MSVCQFRGLLGALVLLSGLACQSSPSDSGDAPMDGDSAPAGREQPAGSQGAEKKAGISFPQDPAWQQAPPVSADVQRPEKISGPDFDLYGQLEDRRYFLGVCFLGLVIGADGRVERSYFLAPQRASKETRDLLLDTVQSWRFDPATRQGVPLRVRYILSITDCPYLPVNDP